jgi:diguanylate cyclase (GGDEF)-like protein
MSAALQGLPRSRSLRGIGVAHVLPVDPAASNRGLPSPQTATFVALAGLTVAFIRQSKSGVSIWADVGALALVALALFLLGGYVFRVYQLVGIGRSNLTAVHTLFCLFLLTFVMAERRATEGALLAVVVSRGMGGRAARMLLPGIVVVPFLWLVLIAFASRPGWLQETYARAIAAPLMALAAFGMVAWLAQRTNALERELQQQSSTDELTEVLNRRGFYAVASYGLLHAGRLGTGATLFFFDLDGLKQINDRFGHEAGSALIRRFAELLVKTFRTTDTVARLGGDEFIVLAIATQVSAEDLLKRLSENVMRSNGIDSTQGEVAYSAGYVEVANPAAAKIGEIVARADALMYEQKLQRKSLPTPAATGIVANVVAA